MTPPLALYIHWPFCASKCPYCDFNAHVREGGVDQAEWLAAYLADMAHWRERTGARPLTSIFFGGGTPSLMEAKTVAGIIDHANALWGLDQNCEITLEANPTSSETGKFAAFRDAGVNRLSIGVQALNDADLSALGRNHDTGEVFRAIDAARAIFDRYSIDLIYARPDQTLEAWEEELKTGLSITGGHLSLYQLTIEPGTQFHTLYKTGRLTLPDEDRTIAFYQMTQDVCADFGMPAYEVSNHAKPGQASRHNMTYWTGGDYLGIGAGAHGRIATEEGRVATLSHHAPEIWLDTVKKQGTGVNRETVLDATTQAQERLMLGLRIDAGVPISAVAGHIDTQKLAILQAEGLIEEDPDHISVSDKGKLLLNGIVGALIKG